MSTETDSLSVDLLVVGGGMAGMTAAAFAAEHGLQVLVVEKGEEIGGSALISGGGLWTAADFETLRRTNPLGEEGQARTLIDNYDAVGDFIRALGADISDKAPYLTTQSFPGWARSVDMAQYMKLARLAVEVAGGFVVTRSTVDALLFGPEGVTGGLVTGPDGNVEVQARWTLLATGGFQNDPELRARYIGPQAAGMIVRSNFVSDGQGLRLGQSAGAAVSPHMDGWYGHTIPYPVVLPLDRQDFLPIVQFYLSPRALLLDADGRRFTDESLGYYLNAQAVSRLPQGRALILFDEALRAEDTERYGVDRFDFARRRGAHVAEAGTIEALARDVEPWGYGGVAEAVASFNAAMVSGDATEPPRTANRRPLRAPAFHAIEVQPAITFTHGGLSIDAQARVLDAAGRPISGLLAAGADAGGTYHRAYAGGLAMASAFGLEAARTVLADLRPGADVRAS
ncbi:MAG: FAD-dependent oxidoreductase [Alphaproteobacteria bacterium]|nr:FAD-dependent oxidoreductase [Alphaproteobacteria bacterium]